MTARRLNPSWQRRACCSAALLLLAFFRLLAFAAGYRAVRALGAALRAGLDVVDALALLG